MLGRSERGWRLEEFAGPAGRRPRLEAKGPSLPQVGMRRMSLDDGCIWLYREEMKLYMYIVNQESMFKSITSVIIHQLTVRPLQSIPRNSSSNDPLQPTVGSDGMSLSPRPNGFRC